MSLIHVLDDNTINKIAAGEVVERPASVVKELVENSIDAGATKIEVEIMAGGTSLMRVTDNGCGMSMEDAKLAIERHATSKIREVGDLYSLGTLGFRGEALPTIAAVSRFRMRTRKEGAELGTEVRIVGGVRQEIGETGCSLGTTIQVEDLFFNTPARKKFLKTTHTEGGRISDFITKLALSCPDIAFRLINNNKAAAMTPGNGSLFDAIRSIYGSQAADALLALSFEDEDIKITGYITKPSMLKSSRAWQTFIVNGRIISNKAIAKAIDNAYHSLLPKAGFPLVVLNITVPQRSVDVNVHPQKSEMKFEDEGRIFKAVYKAVVDAIRPVGQTLEHVAGSVQHAERHCVMEPMQFVAPKVSADGNGSSRNGFGSSFGITDAGELYRTASEPTMRFAEAQAVLQGERAAYGGEPTAATDTSLVCEARDAAYGAAGDSLREAAPDAANIGMYQDSIMPIGQVDRCYIIAQDKDGLYIVDQHAAHERILYDKFSAMAERIPSQQLLVHPILSFDAREAALVLENQELFRRLGFDMEACGAQDFRLKEVPADVPVSEAEDMVREILAKLYDMHETTAQEIRHACLATMACRAAIKSGDELNFRQMRIVLDELSRTARPYTCPHGRPTILKFSSEELAKMFKRT
ncbi:DNA mismatch repair endonuclease MutL [Selenomonas sp.]|uniref:DNA mismatch repair endonuclease MutL n=1 Tax=Selenomonas sp. TaxID=2053611 RepID=UPI003FA30875